MARLASGQAALDYLARHRARLSLLLLCLLAAARVFIFSAAFPFFNNVDEPSQFDLVVKYSRGQIPRGFTPFSSESARFITLYSSPEFLLTPARAQELGLTSPLWKQPQLETSAGEQLLINRRNFESSQPPLYYGMAAIWMNIGRLLGLDGGQLLYWIRFLNLPLIIALVYLSYAVALRVTNDHALGWSVALLVAFIPQDIFYSIQNDNLSALIGTAILLLLARWSEPGRVRTSWAIATGLLVAAAYLTKLSNIAFVLCAVLTLCAIALFQRNRSGVSLFVCLVAALVPICLWILWCRENFGDLTGSAGKIAALTWTRKPVSDWWSHPIFSLRGAWTFLFDLLARFWRGEFVWHGETLCSASADWFYVISSLVFPTVALIGLRHMPAAERRTYHVCAVILLSCIVFLALLSIQFDFGNCPYPSNRFPYFTSGRLMMVAIVPFALLYVRGLFSLLTGLGVRPLLALSVVAIAITANEIWISRGVFASPYNWFHL